MPANKDLIKLGRNFKAIREKKNISQADFAEKAGLQQSYISSLENGKINVTYTTLISCCNALEITPIHVI